MGNERIASCVYAPLEARPLKTLVCFVKKKKKCCRGLPTLARGDLHVLHLPVKLKMVALAVNVVSVILLPFLTDKL